MDIIAIGTLFESFGLPIGIAIAIFVFLVKVQADASKSDERNDKIITGQLDISVRQLDILGKQTSLMVELDAKTSSQLKLASEGFNRMDENHKLTTLEVVAIKTQFEKLLPAMVAMQCTITANDINMGVLKTDVGALHAEITTIGTILTSIIGMLNNSATTIEDENK